MSSRAIVPVLALTLVSGCAWSSQQITLNPTLGVNDSNLGAGRRVFVEVEDERRRKSLGTKLPQGGGELTSTVEPTAVVNDAVVQGLQKQGFSPWSAPGPDVSQLRIELRALDYEITQGFWSGGLDVDVAMKAICIVGDRREYEELHRGKHEENIQVVQSQSNNEYYINDALSQAINAVLNDRELVQCLAARDAGAGAALSPSPTAVAP